MQQSALAPMLLLLCLHPVAVRGANAVAVLTRSGNTAGSSVHLVRKGDSTELNAVAGELFFDGDTLILSGAAAAAELQFCSSSPSSFLYKLGTGRFVIQNGKPTGGNVPQPVQQRACQLPVVEENSGIAVMTERELTSERGLEALSAADLARLSSADRAALQAITQTLTRNPQDLPSRISRAVLLQNAGLGEAATAAYLAIARDWPEQQWARTLGYSVTTKTSVPGTGGGTLYAAFIGISKYEQPNIRPLNFADADAVLFASFLAKTRAQAFSPSRRFIQFINADARTSAVRSKLTAFFEQTKAEDSVMLYIAAHGVGPNDTDDGFVVLYDTKPEAVYDNSLSMSWIRQFLVSQASRVRHVYLFVDTCHANRIGPIRNFASADPKMAQTTRQVTGGKVFAMFGSGDNEVSVESSRYGGGHGAFTYFLLRGLNITSSDSDYATADRNHDGLVDYRELSSYVVDNVKRDTHDKQWPQPDLRIDRFEVETKLEGLRILPCCGSTNAGVGSVRDPNAADVAMDRSVEWQPPASVDERAAQEEISQQVLYKYLKGDEVPQTAQDFQLGLDATERARASAGESLYLSARAEFFRGRLLIFQKNYDEALARLERSIRMDPASPYPYNALGIAYLELRRYDDASAAFQDAIRRAVNWAYPRHNLALAAVQRGDYNRAVALYRDAKIRMPQYSYLPYSLGLIYQRLNQPDDAVREYNLAFDLAPSRAAPLVAFGSVMADEGRTREARRLYEKAATVLASNPEREVIFSLRHNRGELAARKSSGLDEAKRWWDANITEGDYMPSRFALARAFGSAGAKKHRLDWLAISLAEYREIIAKLPEQNGASIEAANLLANAGRKAEALDLLNQALTRKPGDPELSGALARLRVSK